VRTSMPYAPSTLIDDLARMYWRRYGRPLMITETASLGSIRRRRAWLGDSVAAVRRVRGRGVRLIGYTWWPLFSLVAWGYRQRTHDIGRYFLSMGLWELDHDAKLRRVRTPLVDAYAAIVDDGAAAVGPVTRTRRD
jgi:beta-glucosidase